MIKKFIAIIILSNCWFNQSFSYIASVAVWKKSNKKVVILGDVHIEGESDVCHKQSLIPFLETLATRKKQTAFILEHQPEESVKKRKA